MIVLAIGSYELLLYSIPLKPSSDLNILASIQLLRKKILYIN